MTTDALSIIELRHVSLFKNQATLLDDITLAVRPASCHVILGANGAGKTNLLKLLCGIYAPSKGEIYLQGQPCRLNQELAAQNHIAYCGQDFELFENLTILDNFFIGYHSSRSFWFSRTQLKEQLKSFFEEYGFSFSLDWPVSMLKAPEKCLLQLACALFSEPSVLLIDEFETLMNHEEILHVYSALKIAHQKGIAIVLAAHTFPDNLPFVEQVISLENGHAYVTAIENNKTIHHIPTSAKISESYTNIPKFPCQKGKKLIEAENISTRHLKNVSFTLFQGEIVGICGLNGSGRSSFLTTIAGLCPLTGGTLQYIPDKAHVKIGYLPEESSVFSNISLPQNVTIANFSSVKASTLFISPTLENITYNDYVKRLGIKAKTDSPRKLSKGNRQKLLLARCLHSRCNVYLLDNPTTSVDPAGKLELYNILNSLTRKHAGIIFVSSDLNELVHLCDRILLFSHGEIIQSFDCSKITKEELYQYLISKN